MKLDYIYHSGFAIEADGVTVIIDYYKDSSETEYNKGIVHDYLLGRPGELYVLSSHFHPDHFNREVLLWKAERPDIHYIFSKDILKHRRATREDATYINKGDVYEDPNIRIEAFGSTDVGISFLIDLQGIRLFHAGDLNNWHWEDESTPAEIREAANFYHQELETLARETDYVDLALFPVDPRLGKDYTRGAREFVDRIHTLQFAPMHFWEKYEKANAFREYVEKRGGRFLAIGKPGEEKTIN
mgnify:CR=1 FL=1